MTSPEIYSKGLRMKLNDQQKDEIIQFIEDNYSGYFITIQLPPALKSLSLDITEKYLTYVLRKFEKHSQAGNEDWIKHPYRFIGFYENLFGQGTYHIHILGSFINPKTNERLPTEKIRNAMEKANKHLMKRYKLLNGLDDDIQLVKNMYKASDYCIKELIFQGFVDSDRILISDLLFKPRTKKYKDPKKRQTKARLKQKAIKHSYERIAYKNKLSSKYPTQMLKHSKHRAFIKIRKHKPSEKELEQKALISSQNTMRIKEYANQSTNC